jgi:hypothetical protein
MNQGVPRGAALTFVGKFTGRGFRMCLVLGAVTFVRLCPVFIWGGQNSVDHDSIPKLNDAGAPALGEFASANGAGFHKLTDKLVEPPLAGDSAPLRGIRHVQQVVRRGKMLLNCTEQISSIGGYSQSSIATGLDEVSYLSFGKFVDLGIGRPDSDAMLTPVGSANNRRPRLQLNQLPSVFEIVRRVQKFTVGIPEKKPRGNILSQGHQFPAEIAQGLGNEY